ncbi:MAG: IucA/IucC family protein [Bdellovibrionota bacterium]
MKNSWAKVNRKLIARAISELSFEEVVCPVENKLTLKNGAVYTFSGKNNIWGNVLVEPETLRRNGEEISDAGIFFRDSLPETGMSEFVLGQFFEEMSNTLSADMIARNLPGEKLLSLDGDEIQSYLDGHPKILLNKGRMGWTAEDSALYSPESGKTFKLLWVAVEKSLLSGTGNPAALLLSDKDQATLKFNLPANYTLLPVHPWQWENIIETQYRNEIEKGTLRFLGKAGDLYRAQVSLRTLTNVSHPGLPDVKLSLSILNTSCVRGLPESSVVTGPKVSKTLKMVVENDKILARTEVLTELAGLSFVNPLYKNTEAPYRLKETLGVVIRESALSKLAKGESHQLTAALFHRDSDGVPFIKTLIDKSGLSVTEWFGAYFCEVVIPLYHLQVKYGVGLVAHGQNIMLKMKEFRPSGIFIKDFQGDLRLLEGLKIPPFEGLDITRLPAHYLIHDLFTGHFITVLRFISPLVEESLGLSEKDFYQLLGKIIGAYEQGLSTRPAASILRPRMERVLLNKVRFAIGYGDTQARPLPILGTELKNPLGDNL